MPINKDSIKIMKSQVLDDTAEGGGMMTDDELVNGQINDLFPSISRLDGVYGKVTLRKIFLSVRTMDRATYYGSHVVLTEQTKDPLVSVIFFTTDDWFDTRTNAVNAVQSYLAVGSQYMAALFGNHYKDSRLVTLLMELTTESPNIGSVYALTSDSINYKFVRVLQATSKTIEGLDAENRVYKKKEVTLLLGNGLPQDYTGTEVSASSVYTSLATKINKTVVADSSTYYGVARLAEAVTAGQMRLKVNSIYQSIVPSAQSSTPVTDFGIGTSISSMLGLGTNVSRSVSYSFSSNGQVSIGDSVKPGSLTLSTYRDDGNGNFLSGSGSIIGSVNYNTGIISLGSSVASTTVIGTLTYERVAVQSQVGNTGYIGITLENRGFSYVFNCFPTPAGKSLRIDYMSGGAWYSLYDVGGGKIAGLYDDIGSGTLNAISGTVALSLKYLPDIDSNILFFWGKSFSILNLPSKTIPCTVKRTLTTEYGKALSISKGSLNITWTQSGTQHTILDNGVGGLTQNGVVVGKILYNGYIEFTPTVTPLSGTPFNIEYTESETYQADCASLTGVLPSTLIEPKTISFKLKMARIIFATMPIYAADIMTDIVVSGDTTIGYRKNTLTQTFVVRDDGLGNLKLNITNTTIGTINYVTGDYSIDPSLIDVEIAYYAIGLSTVELNTVTV